MECLSSRHTRYCILQFRSSIIINNKKIWPLLHKRNISYANDILHNIENSSSVLEEDNISCSNKKLYIINDKTLCNFLHRKAKHYNYNQYV